MDWKKIEHCFPYILETTHVMNAFKEYDRQHLEECHSHCGDDPQTRLSGTMDQEVQPKACNHPCHDPDWHPSSKWTWKLCPVCGLPLRKCEQPKKCDHPCHKNIAEGLIYWPDREGEPWKHCARCGLPLAEKEETR
jgi:hypothetical protein